MCLVVCPVQRVLKVAILIVVTKSVRYRPSLSLLIFAFPRSLSNFPNELDQMMHSERDNGQRAGDGVVREDMVEIVQNQIAEALVLLHVIFDTVEEIDLHCNK